MTIILQRLLGLFGVALLGFVVVPDLQSQFRTIPVRSCPAADSMLGALGDDHRARVQGQYRAALGQTVLTAGAPGDLGQAPYRFDMDIWYPGDSIIAATDAASWSQANLQLGLYVRGRHAEALQASQAARAVLILDDSIEVALGAPRVGTFRGPRELLMLPVALTLRPEQLLSMLRAGRVALEIGTERYRMTPQELRDARGVYRVALCGGVNGVTPN